MEPQRTALQPGQESVWDYPRPPRVEPTSKHVKVIFNGVVIADTRRALRVLETSHPPVYYIPPQDLRREYLRPTRRRTYCEFKGSAHYFTLAVGDKYAENAAWTYPEPSPPYAALKDYVAFILSGMDACYIDDEPVTPQPGDFYGGWITHDIVGPFKGEPGTHDW